MKVSWQWPDWLEEIMLRDEYVKDGDYSVTETLQPARCAELVSRHPELKRSLDSILAAKVGIALHQYIQIRTPKHIETEKLVTIEVLGKTIAGHIDYDYKAFRFMADLKSGKTWKYIYADWKDFIGQLSLYAYMLGGVEKAEVYICFLDYIDGKKKQSGYPQRRYASLDFTEDLWTDEECFHHLSQFVVSREEMKDLPDDSLPFADPGELWDSGSCYKVYRSYKNVKADRIFRVSDYGVNADHAAMHHAAMLGDQSRIKYFQGELKRCHYCPASSVCIQYKESLNDS